MTIKTGIILAAGTGSRLAPINNIFNKHLIPVHNKFVIDYPLTTLKTLGIKYVNVVLGGNHFEQVVSHIKDGNHLGLSINYIYQKNASGIAEAINLCQRFVSQKNQFITILGDNVFENPIKFNYNKKAEIALHKHSDLYKFGVASIKNNKIVKIEEKPTQIDKTLDNYAISGCYLFDQRFFDFFSKIKPSLRNEYEITDIIKMYNEIDELGYNFVDGMWSDAGSHEAVNFVNNFFYQKDKQ